MSRKQNCSPQIGTLCVSQILFMGCEQREAKYTMQMRESTNIKYESSTSILSAVTLSNRYTTLSSCAESVVRLFSLESRLYSPTNAPGFTGSVVPASSSNSLIKRPSETRIQYEPSSPCFQMVAPCEISSLLNCENNLSAISGVSVWQRQCNCLRAKGRLRSRGSAWSNKHCERLAQQALRRMESSTHCRAELRLLATWRSPLLEILSASCSLKGESVGNPSVRPLLYTSATWNFRASG
mmetsp:Transcript_18537/g.49752  ORF Transcript_18537/g.49752 Transcript_18537/m.49752 type:complete len:239 (-) Transcript_18537:1906-2622(-)